jgi:hypothetical protein
MRTATCDVALAGDLIGEDTAVVNRTTSWRVAWELLMVGPFTSCLINDRGRIRHVTAASLARAAAVRTDAMDGPLHLPDFRMLPRFASTTPLPALARSVVEDGWEFVAIGERPPLLVSARTVFRALNRSWIGTTDD